MDEIQKSDIDRNLFAERVKQAGSLRRLAARLRIPAGTLSAIILGTRRPNATHRRKLIRAGLMQDTRPRRQRIPWKTIAVEMAKGRGGLHFVLLWAGVDPERARSIIEREGVL